MISGGGNLLVDLEESAKVNPGQLGTTHEWVGNNELEKKTSQFTSYILQNKNVPGVESSSKKIMMGDDGEPFVSVSTVLDANNDYIKDMLTTSPELQQHVKDGKLTLNWEKSINNLGDGLAYELDKNLDYGKIADEANVRKDGSFTQNVMVGDEVISRESTDDKNTDVLVTRQFINSKDIITNQVVQKSALAKAKAIVEGPPNRMMDFLRKTLKIDESIVTNKGFNNLSFQDKRELLASFMVEDTMEFIMGVDNIGKKKATQEDVDFYNANAKAIEQGQSVEPLKVGDNLYFTEIRKAVKSIAPQTLTDAQRLGMTNDAVYQDIVSTVENIYNIENTDKRAELYVQNIKNIDPEADIVTVKTYLDNLAKSKVADVDDEFRALIERGEYTKAAERQGLPTASGLISYKATRSGKEKDTFIPLTGNETNVMKSMLSYMADVSGFNKKQASTQYLKYKKQRKDTSPSGLPIIQPMGPN